MLHLDDVGPDTPRLPERQWAALSQLTASAIAHAAAAMAIAFVFNLPMTSEPAVPLARATKEHLQVDVRHIVFLASDPRPAGSGGGGGGNRQAAPIRRAEAVGVDAITLRVKQSLPAQAPASVLPAQEEIPLLPSVVLDAKPLASGAFAHLGLPTGGVLTGTSTGPGSSGGVGTGAGVGIGPGEGPGVGPGSGGGTGGGVFRPGGAVSAPRVIAEVKPRYTDAALLRKIQGAVVLELVVTHEGRPSQVRVVRSLDPEGLDHQAVAAVVQWRFEPGRLAGTPVDVLVTVVLDFRIQ